MFGRGYPSAVVGKGLKRRGHSLTLAPDTTAPVIPELSGGRSDPANEVRRSSYRRLKGATTARRGFGVGVRRVAPALRR